MGAPQTADYGLTANQIGKSLASRPAGTELPVTILGGMLLVQLGAYRHNLVCWTEEFSQSWQ